VLGDEVSALRATYGDDTVVWDAAEGEHRTRVVNGACVFLRQNRCMIHGEPHYPRVCRGFPWIDGEHGGPYPYDVTICPELASSTR
jgi:Fe-S-cluster containining protein